MQVFFKRKTFSFEFWKVFIANYTSIGNRGYMLNVSYTTQNNNSEPFY